MKREEKRKTPLSLINELLFQIKDQQRQQLHLSYHCFARLRKLSLNKTC